MRVQNTGIWLRAQIGTVAQDLSRHYVQIKATKV